MHNLKNILNHQRREHKGMLWMMIPCIFLAGILAIHLLGLNFLAELKLSSFGYLLPIFIGICIGGHILMIHLFKRHGGNNAMSNEKIESADILSYSGLHWHPELTIYVKGEKQEIPHIGLSNANPGMMHQMIMRVKHGRHGGANEQGIIHLKFQGVVRKSDITLGQIFKKWCKDIRSFGINLKMTVNGKENTEYENYVMRDKDKIELRYE